MPELIYIADDEPNIRELISSFLKKEGYEVRCFPRGDDLLKAFTEKPSGMVILDIMMPGTDGLSLCTMLRQKSNVPIIIVSARDSEIDRITGITLGSDDYLTKPFSPVELVARVKALFRRLNLDRSGSIAGTINYGNLNINLSTREASCGGQLLDLTPTELALMTYMFENSTKAISREELLKNVWKFDFDVDTRATDDVIKRLRKKLAAAGASIRIESVWGYGFRLSCGDANEND